MDLDNYKLTLSMPKAINESCQFRGKFFIPTALHCINLLRYLIPSRRKEQKEKKILKWEERLGIISSRLDLSLFY